MRCSARDKLRIAFVTRFCLRLGRVTYSISLRRNSANTAGAAKCASGDYELSGTIETIKKLVYEIMLVKRGEMLHDAEFGNRVRLKELQNTADLIEQGRDIQSRIMALPMVEACSVSARYGDTAGSEMVIFTAKVKTKSGTEISVSSTEGI